MKKKSSFTYNILFVILFLFVQNSFGQILPPPLQLKDTTKIDSIAKLHYNFKNNKSGKLFLNNHINTEVIYDAESGKYIFVEKVGEYYIKHPYYMNAKEYEEYRLKKDMLSYYKSKLSAIGGKKKNSNISQKNLLPKYYVNSNFFENIFGGNTIEMNPQGSILIKMGILYQKVENPQISERNRKSFTFDFNQQISASLSAKVGTRLKVNANFDTQSTFNFQNLVKLEYTPTEDDIIQKIELGNVSMPLKNSLINGAQNLIGVKTQLKFGKTKITGVFSQQKSETKTIAARGSSSINSFELKASDYDENRHFFLAQKFRDNYNNSLVNYPLINSPYQITRVEIWVTNKNSNTQDIRNIVALSDLGEQKEVNISNSNVTPSGTQDATNNANNLSTLLTANGQIRNISTVNAVLSPFAMQQGRDYSLLENATKLKPTEFTINPSLGYINLNRRLSESEVLAVAFEYTENGKVYKVGEFSNDGITPPNNLVVKLLRSEVINTSIPLWKLMMKNVYSLGAYQLQPKGFRFELLYNDDNTGVPINILQGAQTSGVSDKTLLNLLNIDRLDQSQNTVVNGDGYFDYVNGITVDSQKGLIIFPEIEPFGNYLKSKLTNSADDKFVFEDLYKVTQSEAVNNFQQKDKYVLKGYYKSDDSRGIPLGIFNAQRGSVTVTSGGRTLVEGVDYVVDYQIGNVQIINPNLINSDAPIQVSVENNNGFNQQRRSFIGLDIEHQFSDKLIAGATILNLNEQPITEKAQFGLEPVNNTIFGFNISYNTEVPRFTKWVNKLPNIDTDVPSNFSIRAETAYLVPGAPKKNRQGGEPTSYLDDFEAAQIPIALNSPRQWFMASTPQGQTNPALINLNGDKNNLDYGKKRSKISWYNIDRLFYGSSSLKPGNIDNEEKSRAEVRQIQSSELFPNLDLDITQSNILRTFDISYFPAERGSYNYDTQNVSNDDTFTDPQNRWAGIMRSLTTTDFQQANIEYLQFWLMDPYENYSINNSEGFPSNKILSASDEEGDLYINLGNISEDILKDGRRMFENGLPEDGAKNSTNTTQTIWSDIPTVQSLIYAFNESDNARTNQDIGLDGLNDDEEKLKFQTYLNNLPAGAKTIAEADPSSDDFHYFRGSDLDDENASIIKRYKKFTLTQGNSPTANLSAESFPTSATSFPDVEDINKDQTMNTVESYYQYKVSLNKIDLAVGKNNIVDKREVSVKLANGATQNVTWYQFRVPINTPDQNINGISGFSSIRFMRMFLTKFKIPVVLRFAKLELIRGDWRRYTKTLPNPPALPLDLSLSQLQNFTVGAVNIEENENRQPIPYVLPPGIVRERLQGSTTIQRQNEQSISLKINDLAQNETRAVYKNVSADMRIFKNLKMFIHVEGVQGKTQVQDNELLAIIKLGSDNTDNYYQIEIPLKITNFNATTPIEIWPEENNLNVALENLGKLKLQRFNDGVSPNILYPANGQPSAIQGLQGYEIRVKGNPNLGNVKTIMLGIKNMSTSMKSAEIWFDELRLANYDNKGGWATVVNADANFADFATISMAGRAQTIGFGSIDQRVNERSQEEVKQYNINTNLNLGMLLPKNWGISLPFNYNISEEFRDPKYDPQYQDVLFKDAKGINPNSDKSRDYTHRRNISLINVKKNKVNPDSKKHIYDVENVSVSFAYNDTYHRDYNVERFKDQNVRASANYNYNFNPFTLSPFKKSAFLNNPYLKLIKDININLLPTSIAVNSNIIRSYNEQLSRPLISGLPQLPTLIQRNYLFDWNYNVAYDITKSMQFTFNATNNYIYDTFNNNEDIQLFNNFFNIGRPNHYHQTLNATYNIPLNKIPGLNFVNASYNYTADFDWQSSSNSTVKFVGNTIQNANTKTFSSNLNFAKLYKDLNIYSILAKKTTTKNKQKVAKTDKDKKTKRAFVPSSQIKTKSFGQKLAKTSLDILTSIKKFQVSYAENNGTLLPGYVPQIGFLGRDNFNGGLAPTFGFVFGSQSDIRDLALSNNWLISRSLNDPIYNKTYSTTHFDKLDFNIILKPIKNLDINLTANRVFTKNRSQQLDVVDNAFSDTPINEIGNFSISYSLLKTSFNGNGDETFIKFKNYRSIIANRLATQAGLSNTNGFGNSSQQVLLPAFLAAYSGKNPNNIALSAFRNTPIPNWNISYKGLMGINWFKSHFRSFTLTHGYRSAYAITGYTRNLIYNEADPFGNSNLDISANFNPKTLFSSLNLVEEFSPLIKVDIKMRNSVSFKAEIKKDRALNLNFNNNTLTVIKGKEYIFGFGYRFKDLKMRFKTGNKTTTYKGDLNLRADFSIRDNATMIRAIDVENDQVTGGQRLVSFKFLADYTLTKNILASFFFDKNTSRYAISTTFPRQSISAGLTLRYNLGN